MKFRLPPIQICEKDEIELLSQIVRDMVKKLGIELVFERHHLIVEGDSQNFINNVVADYSNALLENLIFDLMQYKVNIK